jgi:hypothetical protein
METSSNLSTLTYEGRCYDAGEGTPTKCSFCGKPIRLVFILKSRHGSMLMGKCCFKVLKAANPEAHLALRAGQAFLEGMARGSHRDARRQEAVARAWGKEAAWKALKKAARKRIGEYRKFSGDLKWLPKPLFDLRGELGRRPRKDYKSPSSLSRWYDRRNSALRALLFPPA